MKGSTPVLAAVALLAIGGATFWLAASSGEEAVRQVDQVLADPAAHRAGSFTLIAIPQPHLLSLDGPQGTMQAWNKVQINQTRNTSTWSRDGVTYFSTTTLSVQNVAGDLSWTAVNETRLRPDDKDVAWAPDVSTFHLGTAGQAFPVQQVSAQEVGVPVLWAFYDRAPGNPMKVTPSQFNGRLMDHLPDGTPLPDGVLIWSVESFLSQCSSKFVSPDVAEKYDLAA